MIAIITDKQQLEYSEWLAQSIEEMQKHNVRGIAIVALCDDENITGYWNMSQRDKAMAETEIRYDVIDGFINANTARYFDIDDDCNDVEDDE